MAPAGTPHTSTHQLQFEEYLPQQRRDLARSLIRMHATQPSLLLVRPALALAVPRRRCHRPSPPLLAASPFSSTTSSPAMAASALAAASAPPPPTHKASPTPTRHRRPGGLQVGHARARRSMPASAPCPHRVATLYLSRRVVAFAAVSSLLPTAERSLSTPGAGTFRDRAPL